MSGHTVYWKLLLEHCATTLQPVIDKGEEHMLTTWTDDLENQGPASEKTPEEVKETGEVDQSLWEAGLQVASYKENTTHTIVIIKKDPVTIGKQDDTNAIEKEGS